jgi:hypothetical protein
MLRAGRLTQRRQRFSSVGEVCPGCAPTDPLERTAQESDRQLRGPRDRGLSARRRCSRRHAKSGRGRSDADDSGETSRGTAARDSDHPALDARQIHADDQIVVMAHKIDCRHPSAVICPPSSSSSRSNLLRSCVISASGSQRVSPPAIGALLHIAEAAWWMMRPNFAGSASESSRGTRKYSVPAGSSVMRSRASSPPTVKACGRFFGSAA